MGETTLAEFFSLEGKSRPCRVFSTNELEQEMRKFETLIVGSHFRPPAKQLLAVLAAGHSLRLEEDNENAYDAAAVRVMLDLTDAGGMPLLGEAQLKILEAELPGAGMTVEQLVSAGPIQLGFVPAQDGKPLAKARLAEPELVGNLQVRELPWTHTTLGFALDGSPRLQIETGPDHAIEHSAPCPLDEKLER